MALIWNEGDWRDRAEEVLAISADARNPECQRILRELAATYERLARLTAEFKSVGLPQACTLNVARIVSKFPGDLCPVPHQTPGTGGVLV